MKRHGKNAGEMVDAHLGLFGSPSEEEMVHAEERAHRRLSSEAAPAVSAQTVKTATRRPAWGWRLAAIAAAAVVVIVVTTQMEEKLDAHAVVEIADGGLYRVDGGEALSEGDRIDAGEAVRTNGGSGTVLRLADGSGIEMRSKSELLLERADDGIRIRLGNGGIIVNAAKQQVGRRLYVQTKDVTVSVVGTVFLVNAEESGSRVAVIEGEVRVQQGTTDKKLLPGEQISTSQQLRTILVREEIAWSHEAEAHLSLLQQNTLAATATSSQVAFEEASIRPSGPIPAAGAGQRGGPDPDNPCVTGALQIDPGRLSVTRTSLYWLIRRAYGKGNCTAEEMFASGTGIGSGLDPVSGGPGWVKSAKFDIHALFPKDSFTATPGLTDPKVQRMLQVLLSSRFKLVLGHEKREAQGYVLTPGKDGVKLSPARDGDAVTWSTGYRFGKDQKGETVARLSGAKASIADLVFALQEVTGSRVVDRTGITGNFNYRVEYAPFDGGIAVALRMVIADSSYPSLFTAIEEQLGLRLESGKIPIDVLTIERVEKPSEN